MGVSKIGDHIRINIKVSKPSQGLPTSSKVPNQNGKDMDVLCTFKIKIERAKNWNMGVSKTSDNAKIKIKIPNPSQDPSASSEAPK